MQTMYHTPPEPSNLLAVLASTAFVLWVLRLVLEARRLVFVRTAVLHNRVVRVPRLGSRLHIFERVTPSHFTSLLHTRHAFQPSRVPTVLLPVALRTESLSVLADAHRIRVKFEFECTGPVAVQLLWNLDSRAVFDDAALAPAPAPAPSGRHGAGRGRHRELTDACASEIELQPLGASAHGPGESEEEEEESDEEWRGSHEGANAEEAKESLPPPPSPPPSSSHEQDLVVQSADGATAVLGREAPASPDGTPCEPLSTKPPQSRLLRSCTVAGPVVTFPASEDGTHWFDETQPLDLPLLQPNAPGDSAAAAAAGGGGTTANTTSTLLRGARARGGGDVGGGGTSGDPARPHVYPLAVLVRPLPAGGAEGSSVFSTMAKLRPRALRQRSRGDGAASEHEARDASPRASGRDSNRKRVPPPPSWGSMFKRGRTSSRGGGGKAAERFDGQVVTFDVDLGGLLATTDGSGGGGAEGDAEWRQGKASYIHTVNLTGSGLALVAKEVFGFMDADADECIICMTAPRTTTLLPCRHLCVCSDCFTHIDKCPVCRADFDSYLVLDGGSGDPATDDAEPGIEEFDVESDDAGVLLAGEQEFEPVVGNV